MSKYHDDSARASDPGRLQLSRARLYRGWPERAGPLWRIRMLWSEPTTEEKVLDEHLEIGDSRAATVVSLDPLRVAAFTDELDCTAILSFPQRLARAHSLAVASRLLTVNTYIRGGEIPPTPGPRQIDRYTNFHPVIADFVSDDRARIEGRKREIEEEEWERCHEMGLAHLDRLGTRVRDGSPFDSDRPAWS